MAKKVHLSPGTYVSEKDLTFTVEALGVTTLGLVGETLKGPAFQPLFVNNYDVFKTMFGGTSPEKFRNTQIPKYELPFVAKSYLTQSNQLYVTRVLGLSGYDKGLAYVLKTVGAIDATNVTPGTATSVDVDFKYDVSTVGAVPQNIDASNNALMTLSAKIAALTGVAESKFDTAFASYFTKLNYTSKNWYKGDILEWGAVPATNMTTFISGSTVNTSNATPAIVDAYELPVSIPSTDEATYFLQNELAYDTLTGKFGGVAFALYCYGFSTISASVIKGKVKLLTVPLSGDPMSEYHNKLVATLRSRGKYTADVLSFDVQSLALTNTAAVEADPLAAFTLSGSTLAGPFSYTVSLDKKKKSYIKSVLGVKVKDKDAPLYVEEVYDSVLGKGVRENKIHGLFKTLIEVNDWDHYSFQYQAPVSPWVVSELRGGNVQRLFKVVSISDGDTANTEIKFSIANVDLDGKTFDVLVRSFYDSDKNPAILDKFLNCSMDESDDNFIGKKIGTIDGKYDVNSNYIIIEMADNAPSDAVPAGFEGYEFRTTTGVDVPSIHYKTKYYKPGETIVDPLAGAPIISNGDKVRKAYLGFTDLEYGYDADLLSFKGKISLDGENTYNVGEDYGTATKGFHLDVNAPAGFVGGAGSFDDAVLIESDNTHPYYDIKTRKFTVLLAGGFDGWDEFRDNRTNLDSYKIGQVGFTRSGFDMFASAEFDEVFGTSDYYAYLYGARTFQNPQSTVINILATPGIDVLNNTELVREVVEIVEEKRQDSIYLPTLPDIKLLSNPTSSNKEDWFYPKDIVDELDGVELDSNYTSVYYPWIQVLDSENNANLYIPPTAEVVRNFAYTDNIAHPWYATAGYNRGIVNTKHARLQLDREAQDTLYQGRINPLPTFTDVGVLIWGNRNLQQNNTALNRINVRRLLLEAKKLIVQVANRLLFDPNDARVRSEFLSQVNPILDNIRKERGLNDFRVVLTPEGAEGADRNTMYGKIFLKPTDTLEFIELEFDVTENTVNFQSL